MGTVHRLTELQCNHNFELMTIYVIFMCISLQGPIRCNMTAAQVPIGEITENTEVKKEDLEALKCWLSTQEHLPPISGTVL